MDNYYHNLNKPIKCPVCKDYKFILISMYERGHKLFDVALGITPCPLCGEKENNE